MTEESKARVKARVELLYRTKHLPAYLAFIALYPFSLEDLPGEIWRWIEGYEGLYQISNFGRVKSFYTNHHKKAKILKPAIQNVGYLQVYLYKNGKGKYFKIHRLVAQAFIPNPNSLPEVNHKFGNKLDNYLENLVWATSEENKRHALVTGLSPKGEDTYNSTLTNAQCKEIRRIFIKGDPEFGIRALARKYGVGCATIWRIVNGKTYKNVD